jgi:hypothetical protein
MQEGTAVSAINNSRDDPFDHPKPAYTHLELSGKLEK